MNHEYAELDMLACFPAGTHLKARHLRDAPPCWPVSGLTNATRISFPERRLHGSDPVDN